jgi:hypothetical protein
LKNLDEGYPGIFYAVVATFRAKMFFKKCKKKKKIQGWVWWFTTIIQTTTWEVEVGGLCVVSGQSGQS